MRADRDGPSGLASPAYIGRLPSDEQVQTVGAILIHEGHLVFSLGPHRRAGGNGVVRVGGRREEGERAADCIRREIAEEASADAEFMTPPATLPVTSSQGAYLLGAPQPPLGSPSPLFVDQGEKADGPFHLTYLLHAASTPAPAAECRGLLYMTVGDLRALCERSWITSAFLRSHGRLQLAADIEVDQPLAAYGPPLWFAAAVTRDPAWERELGLDR